MSHDKPLLYHLGSDPGEKFNIADKEPEIVANIIIEVNAHKAGITTLPSIFDLK